MRDQNLRLSEHRRVCRLTDASFQTQTLFCIPERDRLLQLKRVPYSFKLISNHFPDYERTTKRYQ